MITHALQAIRFGFHIFPVQDGEKTPHVTTAPYTLKWSECATNDRGRVVRMWTRWPNANIGVACKPSGLLVVDCDIAQHSYQLLGKCCDKHPVAPADWQRLHERLGPMVDGERVFDAVNQCYGQGMLWKDLTNTYTVTTGSGGRHFYYRWPDGVQASQASIVKGILDIRGNGGTRGGYVLGEGSHTSKGDYVRGPNVRIAPAPEWLVKVCREPPPAPRPEYERPMGCTNYSGLQDRVVYAPEGNRNNCLLWAARAMCADGASQELALEVLGEAAIAAGLTAIEARDTIKSAYRLQGMK